MYLMQWVNGIWAILINYIHRRTEDSKVFMDFGMDIKIIIHIWSKQP